MKHAEQKTAAEIGLLIKSERKRQGVTQMQLAGIAGTGIRFISDLENGKGTIQVQKLLKVLHMQKEKHRNKKSKPDMTNCRRNVPKKLKISKNPQSTKK